MSSPIVSILTPVYRGEQFISRAIESALGQSYPYIELIIVNDGSPDNCFALIQPYLSDRRIKYIEQANAGVAAARNTGIRAASGELIALLDQDDIWLPRKLERQVAYLQENPDVGLVHTKCAYIDNNENIIDLGESNNWPADPQSRTLSGIFKMNPIAAVTAVMRRCCLDAIGLFNETLQGTDDYELWIRMSTRFQIGYIPEILALYRLHESNVSRDKLKMELQELAAIESVIAEFPDVYKKLGEAIVNTRLFDLNFNIARYYEWLHQDSKLARKYYLDAIKNRPTHISSYKFYIWNLLTPAQKKNIRWYLSKLKNSF